jgi:hypothetical protein
MSHDPAKEFAKLHRNYLETTRPEMFAQMKAAGTLEEHCRQRGQEAAEMYETVEAQLMNQPGPENETPAERMKRMEQAPLMASEIVTTDLVYSL